MQGYWQDGRYILASTMQDRAAELREWLEAAAKELHRVNSVTDGQPLVSHNLIVNIESVLRKTGG